MYLVGEPPIQEKGSQPIAERNGPSFEEDPPEGGHTLDLILASGRFQILPVGTVLLSFNIYWISTCNVQIIHGSLTTHPTAHATPDWPETSSSFGAAPLWFPGLVRKQQRDTVGTVYPGVPA